MKNTSVGASSHPSGLPDNYYWFFILYMVALSAFGSFVNDMFTPAFPAMTRAFHTSAPVLGGILADWHGWQTIFVGSF